jgi:arylformamidase
VLSRGITRIFKVKEGSNMSTGKSEWIDISLPLYDSMVQGPIEPLIPHIEFILHRKKMNNVAMCQLNINTHNGTHIDAPYHFIEEGETVDRMNLDTAIGRARVIEIEDEVMIKTEELERHDIQSGERILFKTKNSSRPERMKEFMRDSVYLSLAGAEYLVKKGIILVGIDYISIGGGGMEEIDNTHLTLLNNGIYIIEDLDLSPVKAGQYEMICLPLRIKGGDASPARAIVRPI